MPVVIEEELDVDFAAVHPPTEPFDARSPLVLDLLAEKSERGRAARAAVARRESWLDRDLALVEDAVRAEYAVETILGLAKAASEQGLEARYAPLVSWLPGV